MAVKLRRFHWFKPSKLGTAIFWTSCANKQHSSSLFLGYCFAMGMALMGTCCQLCQQGWDGLVSRLQDNLEFSWKVQKNQKFHTGILMPFKSGRTVIVSAFSRCLLSGSGAVPQRSELPQLWWSEKWARKPILVSKFLSLLEAKLYAVEYSPTSVFCSLCSNWAKNCAVIFLSVLWCLCRIVFAIPTKFSLILIHFRIRNLSVLSI